MGCLNKQTVALSCSWWGIWHSKQRISRSASHFGVQLSREEGKVCLCGCSKLGIDAPEAALLAAAAVASDPEPRNGARDPNDPELELDSLMATLMCS